MGLNSRLGLESLRTIVREHAESLVLALALALVVRWFVLSAFVVRSDSMEPALLKGDIVLGFKPPFSIFAGEGRRPRRGELVIFQCPNDNGMCLRRVVGIAGDRIEMTRQRLKLNDALCTYEPGSNDKVQLLKETCGGTRGHPIALSPDWAEESWGPTVCPPDHFFALNDFRPDGEDSRLWGCVSDERLLARAVTVWISFDWSASNNQPRIRWARSFLSLN